MSATALVRMKRTVLASLCTATALSLTACGPLGAAAAGTGASADSGPYAELSGPEVLNKAVKVTKAATSLRLGVTMTTADGPVQAHLAVDTKGDCAGTISFGTAATTELIKTGDTVYLRFDEAMLRKEGEGRPKEETDAVLKTLLGKWVKDDADSGDAKDLVEFCDLDTYLGGFEANDNIARKGGESAVNGTPTLVLTESYRDEKYTVHVAAKGTPYLLKLQVAGGAEPMSMTFSEFDKPVAAKKPAAKDIADVG
ncbi:hypothetical protein [Streptomyces formicae]|uniref:Lipoprotein n=1 Tax=Streptomyces formicae TaxID=1616117 RepID=A0ABY3WSG7_9ACTN|nr:hypothetical protein [Streptomyces formicae]UNM15588.1 hypothetical protein J4032_32700 [Streptomyces formicae]